MDDNDGFKISPLSYIQVRQRHRARLGKEGAEADLELRVHGEHQQLRQCLREDRGEEGRTVPKRRPVRTEGSLLGSHDHQDSFSCGECTFDVSSVEVNLQLGAAHYR